MEKLNTDNQNTDINLVIEQVQAGDKQAYTHIIRRYQQQIFLYCYYLLKNREEAEDAAQEIFIRGLEHIHHFVPTVSFSAWLYKIAQNHCTDLLKRNARTFKSFIQYKLNLKQQPIHEYTNLIHELLDQLTLKDRQILLLRSLEDYNYEEIATIMGLKSSTIRKRYERLRKKLINYNEKGGKQIEHSFKPGR
ncbi:RNA polymerase sigma factor [Paenibacillus polymyxa]|uniref:DNA-directed RNA polymerase subunit sigma n=1 Tax=Paenibacillus polymyxa (strain SC2) TaxID=886882 RepID=E3EAN5_PAEPS|nr:RNA polymerase sigma factor [Paenibacillus polymyxa]ADO58793.1 DNA-directed RNA polymerase subunit sigma [Paenibacillus polymyxa SC2]WPQ56406.1 RNA polymerase sigma factor [Paenibacillus polymyxa]CCI71332.1 RNA polymerase sigma-E factor [Paenibacillus polymyxa M1]